jgi:uncharacterized membrane protein/predicted flap endonuclease-1-like 5' DNA nuclease
MDNKNDHLVIAYYVGYEAAKAAADDLKDWDKANDDIRLGAIGILTINPKNGRLEVKEVGQRKTKKGALWGAAIGAAAGILTAGVALIPGLVAGSAGGGLLGSLNHKSLGMSDADHEQLVEKLRNGGAALAVMADDFEVQATEAALRRFGGTTATYHVPEETAEVLTATAEAQSSASAAVDEAVEDETRMATAGMPGSAAAVRALAAAGNLSEDEANKLYDTGVHKPSVLMEYGATPAGRAALVEETGLSRESTLRAIKRVDLMRIRGVGVKYAGLLLAAGVDTVPELAQRNPVHLRAKMGEVNALESMVGELPAEATVGDWVDQAKTLPRMIFYE